MILVLLKIEWSLSLLQRNGGAAIVVIIGTRENGRFDRNKIKV